jgi:hypothetical protein
MSHGPAEGDAAVLRLAHHHPGRIRVRSEAFRGGDDLAARARDALLATGNVLRVEHDAGTGSLLIEYEPGRITPDEILARAANAAGLLVDLEEPCRPDRTHGERFLDVCRDLNDAAYVMTGFRVEPRTLLPVGVAVLSGVFFALNRGQRMPRWDNLAYWSVSLFAMLHGREIGATAAARGEAPAVRGEAPEGPAGSAVRAPR